VPSLTCWYYTYWSGFPCEGFELHWRQHRLVLVFPTNDDLTFAVVGIPHQEFHDFRKDVEGNYLKALTLMADVGERVKGARRAERFFGMADLPSFFRKPYGEGWALVGDAGHHKDPTPAYGISDAFCDAELLADAIHQGQTGEQPLEAALAQYEQKRNARAVPDHEYTCQLARLEHWDAPEMLQLRAVLRGNAEDTGHFFAVLAKATAREEFFAPHNMQRIVSRAELSQEPR
jgi:flavin-dependent dehydrogenase